MDKYKNIKQIYVGNILESFHKSYSEEKMSKREASFWRKYDALDNNRSLFYGGDNKILITPKKINPSQIKLVCDLAGWSNVYNLTANHKSDCISSDIISDREFFALLIKIIEENPGVEIVQYRHTPEFYGLVEKIKDQNLPVIFPELVPEEDKFIEEYFHSKRGFRHLWEQVKDTGLKIQIPEGFITRGKKEAIEAAWWFARHKRNFAFKYSRGVQGIGVILNEYVNFPQNYEDFTAKATELLIEGIWDEPCVVVEEYIQPDVNILGGSPNVEMRITRDGKVKREYACAQVIARDGKTFLGVTMNPEVEASPHIQEAFLAAERCGERLASLGYRGVFDMDLVVSRENRLYAVETNLRRTGGTHAHEFCQEILGPEYASKYWVHLQDLSVGEDKRAEFLKILEKYPYKKDVKTGIVPVNPDMMLVDKAPILIVTKSKAQMGEILSEVNRE